MGEIEASTGVECSDGCCDTRCGARVREDEEDTIADALNDILAGCVVVEFWAMMAGALPYGWHWLWVIDRHRAIRPGGVETCETEGDAWAAEYAARPRMES